VRVLGGYVGNKKKSTRLYRLIAYPALVFYYYNINNNLKYTTNENNYPILSMVIVYVVIIE